jgi:hypothetical protein
MSSNDGDRLSIYLVFGEPGGVFIQVATSLNGAAVALISHAAAVFDVTQLVMIDGSPFDMETVAGMLPMDGTLWIRSIDGEEPVASVERRFLAP